MQIFELEKPLAHLLVNDKTIAFSELSMQNTITASNNVSTDALIAYLKDGIAVDIDSYWFPSILVTTNWNKNDDVFTPDDTWPAINTPVNKPVNWMHNATEDNNEIIGVISKSVPVDINYNIITEKKDYFHIAVGSLIWSKYFPAYGKELEDGINNGDLFVSMECHFANFGFALQEPGSQKISFIERNEKTAIFTKYLRWYGGPGIVKVAGKTYRIGRWLKDITFTGMGLVHNPGNIESKILTSFSQAENLDNILENSVLIKNTESTIMAESTNTATASQDGDMDEMAKCKAELADAKKLCAEANDALAKMKETCAKLTEDMTKCSEASKMSEAALAEASNTIAMKDKAICELQASVAGLESSVAAMKKTACASARLEQLKLVNAESWISAEDLGSIDDKTFNTIFTGAKAAFDMVAKASVKPETKTNTVDTATAALESAEADKTEVVVNEGLASASAKTDSQSADISKLSEMFRNSKNKNRKA